MTTVLDAATNGATLEGTQGVVVAMTYGDDAIEREALTARVAKCDRSPAGVLAVRGADALTFLQSLLSQDLLARPAPTAYAALLLQPTGKLDAMLRVRVERPDLVWLDCELGRVESVIASLTRFRIRVDVELEDVTPAIGRIEVRGPQTDDIICATFGAVPGTEPGAVVVRDECWIVRADWRGLPGVECIGARAGLGAVWDALAVPAAGFAAREYVRIVQGIARDGVDVDHDTIPQEAFLERDAVSFTKGCFLGQELVCRIDSRGHVNRFVRRIVVSDAVPPVGAVVRIADREVGAVTSVAAMPTGAVALGMVRKEITADDALWVCWDHHEVVGTLVDD